MLKICNLLALASVSALCISQSNAAINVDSYIFQTANNPDYADSSGIELIDGVVNSLAWGGEASISFANVAALVGGQNIDPVIRFDFGETVTVKSLTTWFADSNGAAGVGMPSSVTLSTDSNAFTQSFGITDPAGSGTTVPVTISGFSVSTDHIILTATRAFGFTMLSEVTFFAVPEPSNYAEIAGMFSLGLVAFTRRQVKKR